MGQIASLTNFSLASSDPSNEQYAEIYAGSEEKLAALFRAIDKDGNGYLETNEFAQVIERYNADGKKLDEKEFLGWFDTHGKPDGRLDQLEFNQYVADVAWSFRGDDGGIAEAKAALPGIITHFHTLV